MNTIALQKLKNTKKILKNNILKITNFHERDFIFFKRIPENCSNFRLIQYYDSGTCYYNSILSIH